VHLMKADWEESKHPRADNGQFGSGSGGSTGSKKPSKTKRKMERRAEAAGQAILGGKAIQTLLGGGSALDKIGWLKTSPKQEGAKEPEPEKPKIPSHDDALELAGNPEKLLADIKSSKEIYPFSHDPAEYAKYVLDVKTAYMRNDADRANRVLMHEKGKYGAKHKTYRGIEKDPAYSNAKKENDRLFAELDALYAKKKKFEAVFAEAGKKVHGLNPYGPEYDIKPRPGIETR